MLRIEIQTDNAAFARNPKGECARILRRLALEFGLRDNETRYTLLDANGNTVGTATFTEGA